MMAKEQDPTIGLRSTVLPTGAESPSGARKVSDIPICQPFIGRLCVGGCMSIYLRDYLGAVDLRNPRLTYGQEISIYDYTPVTIEITIRD